MKLWLLKILSAAMLLAGGVGGLQAQSYSIDWATVAGGGGASTGGVYSVSGTIGQPDAGTPMSGGNYSVVGGFWSFVAAVQQPGTPLLTVTHSGASVVVSWPSPSTGFVLQQNVNVSDSAGWGNSGLSVSDDGSFKSVTINSPAGNLYFRLAK